MEQKQIIYYQFIDKFGLSLNEVIDIFKKYNFIYIYHIFISDYDRKPGTWFALATTMPKDAADYLFNEALQKLQTIGETL